MSGAARTGVVKTWANEETGKKDRKGHAVREERLVERPAYSDVHAPLVVFNPCGGDKVYGVLHLASGLSVTQYYYWKSAARAKTAMKEIAQLADWTRPNEVILATKNLGEQVLEIAIRHGANREFA